MRVRPEAFELFGREYGVKSGGIYGAVFAAWGVLALLSTTETYVLFRLQGQQIPLWRALAQSGFGWLIYGAFTPLILRVGDALPIKGPTWRRRAASHVAFALLLGLGYAVVATVSWRLFGLDASRAPASFLDTAALWYLSGLPLMVLAYFAVHGLGRAIYWFFRNRSAERDSSLLRQEVAEARLAALQTQVHPHFLFNALNAVDTLINDGETDAAGHVLHLLSDILRETLASDRPAEVGLGVELSLVGKYLEIQRVRFSDRLRVAIEVPEVARSAQVPTFVLQPLVENSLRHGIGPRRDAGRLVVRAELRGDRLELSVHDDGRGFPQGLREGHGLGNLRSRLAVMYGDGASVALQSNPWGGATTVVVLPLRFPHSGE